MCCEAILYPVCGGGVSAKDRSGRALVWCMKAPRLEAGGPVQNWDSPIPSWRILVTSEGSQPG